MHVRTLSFLSALALSFPLDAALGQSSEVQRLLELGRSDNRVMQHLDHLVNRIGPRLTGSDNFQNACRWARAEFESYGLANARLEKWGEYAVAFNRGPSSGHMLAPQARELSFGTNAWTAGTPGPVRGPALLAPTNAEELAALRPKLKGAWVLVPSSGTRGPARGAPPPAADAGARGNSSAREASASSAADERAFREALQKAYEEEGIAGTIRASRNELVLTGGSSRVDFAKLPKLPSINLAAADFKAVREAVEAGQDVRLEFDIRNWFEKGPVELDNVIAEIPGSEKPEEIVIVGGHLDSWDGATGTTDNGTGVATTLEAARLLVQAGVKPKRTIRFMLWGGEEQGLLGSKGWIQAHKDELPRISAVLVHDGGTNYCAGINATAPMVKDFEAIFAPVKTLDNEMPFSVREVKGLSPGSSDHDSFLAADVPAFFWNQKGKANYTHTHHTQFDTYDQAIESYERNSAIVIAVGALGIADLPELLSRENLRAAGGRGGGFGGRRLGVMLSEEMTIDELVDDGLALKAGLKVGDRIAKIGDTAVADTDEMRQALNAGPQKQKVTVLRAGQEVSVEIEFPANSGGGGGFARRFGLRLGEGLAIEEVTPDSAAAKAGLKAGDKIVRAAGAKVESLQELGPAFFGADGPVKLVVLREGKEVELALEVPERP